MCHPYGDQAMIMWINDIENVTYFGDRRVKYNANKSAVILKKHHDVCAHYLALHGSYPVQIEQYWKRTLVTPRNLGYHVPKIRYPCGDQDKRFNKTNFEEMYYADPIPCKDSPVWYIYDVYVGRSGKRGI